MRDSSSLSEEQRKAAVALFEAGWGAKSVAARLGAGARAISGLYGRWRVRGGTTLVTKPTKRLFSSEVKLAVERYWGCPQIVDS
jgi:transposase